MQTGVVHYSTSDTGEASYLVGLGAKPPVLDRTDPRRIVYVFELTEEQAEATPHFKDGTGMVSGLAMDNAKKMLMRMIKDGEK